MATSGRLVPTPFRIDPIFWVWEVRSILLVVRARLAQILRIWGLEELPTQGLGPPPMVLEWKYLHSMQRFWGGF